MADIQGLEDDERTAVIREAMAQMAERGRSSLAAPLEQQQAEEAGRTQRATDVRGQGAESFAGLDLETILGSQAAAGRGINLGDIQELLASQQQQQGGDLQGALLKRRQDIEDAQRQIDNPGALGGL